MNKKLLISGGAVCASVAALTAVDADAQEKRPNILLIYVDDLGYSDVSCFGREYLDRCPSTPNLDAFAATGVRFTGAYSAAPISTAARTGLLTGMFPARLGMDFVTTYLSRTFSWDSKEWKEKFAGKKLLPPPVTPILSLEYPTMAEILSDNGYETGIVGKWHLAPHNDVYLGWDEHFGPASRGFQWTAETFGSHSYAKKKENPSSPAYPADEITEKAKEFLAMPHDKPFFLFVSHYYVHTPIKVKSKEILDKYRRLFPDFAEEELQYLAFVDRMDHYIGDLLDSVKANGLLDDTIIIFASDNGGHPKYAFNAPFRGSKWNLYEGGIRLPLIISWKGHLTPSVTDGMVSQMDLLPTLMDVTGIPYSADSFDGESFADELFSGNYDDKRRKPLVWHFPYYHPEGDAYAPAADEIGVNDGHVSKTKPHSAIRDGKYKLIYFYEDDRCELYDIEKDIAEQHDLSSLKKCRTARLKKALFDELDEIGARLPRRQ